MSTFPKLVGTYVTINADAKVTNSHDHLIDSVRDVTSILGKTQRPGNETLYKVE